MFEIIFEDDSLLVLNKPAGIVVTSSQTQTELSLEDILKGTHGITAERAGIVHRLDKDTSGLIVVAKNNKVLEALQAQFKERSIKKQYTALVHGFVEKEGVVEAAIGRNPGDREKFVVFETHKIIPTSQSRIRPALTRYEPLGLKVMNEEVMREIFAGFNKIQFHKLQTAGYALFTLLACFPLTGRTHQIRVHLKYISHPIVGDGKYGGRRTARLDHRWCPRQFLHAAKLEFAHPLTGERLKFEAGLPDDLQKALGKLEIVSSS